MPADSLPFSIQELDARLKPLRHQLSVHPLYTNIRTLDHVRLFMESHVFAVWDFMSLLKALQRRLTCVDLPWIPTAYPASRRFINQIVMGEESDEFEGRSISHFELYLEAMELARADTRRIRNVVASAAHGVEGLHMEQVPAGAREFVECTFQIISSGSIAAMAAAFTFGREDAIPDMFRLLVRSLSAQTNGAVERFAWYLERHIEVDGNDHGPLSLRMVSDVCGSDSILWEEAYRAGEQALQARLKLWDDLLSQIRASDREH